MVSLARELSYVTLAEELDLHAASLQRIPVNPPTGIDSFKYNRTRGTCTRDGHKLAILNIKVFECWVQGEFVKTGTVRTSRVNRYQ